MARIPLLFSLALALILGSLLLSVSGHAPPALSIEPLFPKTISELQTLPFTKITQILTRKEKFAPKTAEFKEMFTLCKDYVAYLESVYKFENPIVDVLGIAKTRYDLMTKAVLAAKDSVSGKLDKKTCRTLKKSTADLTKGFLQIKETIVKISTKYNCKPDAKLTFRESANISDAVLHFRVSINTFMDVVNGLEEKKMKMKKARHQARSLEENENAIEKFFRNFSDKYGGYLGGRTHGRELTEAQKSGKVSRFEKLFGSLFGVKSHGRELTEAEGSFHDFLNYKGLGFGGKVQYDAAGKMKVAGKEGFRSLNRAHYKPVASTEA